MDSKERKGVCEACTHRRGLLCAIDATPIADKVKRAESQCLAGLWGESPPVVATPRSLPAVVPRPAGSTGPFAHSVAVIVISHNYGRFLGDALTSVLTQTRKAAEIVVVDDASTDDTPDVAAAFAAVGVRYVRIEARDVNAAREAGFRATTADVIVFLDADDKLSPKYLETGMGCFTDPQIAVVYGNMQQFGNRSQLDRLPEYQDTSIHWQNCCHAASLVKRAAIVATSAFVGLPDMTRCQHHNDWALWRRVLTNGRRAVRQSEPLLYRQHGDNWLSNGRSVPASYYDRAALWQEPLTIYVPLSGRRDATDEALGWLERQTHPHQYCRVVLLDTSRDARFGRWLRSWAALCDYADVRVIHRPVGDVGLADEDARKADKRRLIVEAMWRIYDGLAGLETEYILTLEDDVLPPDDAVERLFRGMDRNVFSVASPYKSRYSPEQWLIWEKTGVLLLEAKQGLQPTTGNGFGCTLLRRSVLSRWTMGPYRSVPDYDMALYDWIKASGQWRALVDWDCRSIHAGIVPD